MEKKFIFHRGIYLVVLFLLTGCTAYMVGNRKLAQKNYEAAITQYLEHLSQNPDHWQARERLGFAYLKTGRLDKAIQEFTRALGQKPGDPYATYYLGLAWLNKGERAKAVEIWKSYENRKQPLVEEQIKRHLTLLEIAESLRLAKQALAEEKKLQTLSPQPGTVAVFYFKDMSPDNSLRHLQKALAAMIITDLSQVRSLQVVERLRVQFLLAEMELGQTGIVDRRTAPRAGRLLGVESLIVGTIQPGSPWVKTNVACTSGQALVGGFSAAEEQEKFFHLEKEIVFKILQLLRVSLTPEEKNLLGIYHTKNFEAVIFFGQALEALDAGNWKEAKNFFQKALIEDPEFDLARVGSETCPQASAPSIAALGSMSDSEFSAMMEGAVVNAMAEQGLTEIAPEGPDGETGVAEEPAEGSMTIRW